MSFTSFTSIATYINLIIMSHKHINFKYQQSQVNKITHTEVLIAKQIQTIMLYKKNNYKKKKLSERTSVTLTSVINVIKWAREHAIMNWLSLDDISNY